MASRLLDAGMKFHLPVAVVVLGSLMAGISPATGAVMSDQTFNPGDWSQTIVSQSGPAPSFVTGQVLLGGNPGGYRSIFHSYGGPGSIMTGHIFEALAYDPTLDGALASVSFTFDAKTFDAGDSGAVAFGALLRQGGSYYYAGNSIVFPGGWTGQSFGGFSASDFTLIFGGGAALPDFSAAGGVINFGFYASNGTGVGRPTATSSGVDNWTVTTTAATVPEGGSAAIYGAALLALAAWRLRFARH